MGLHPFDGAPAIAVGAQLLCCAHSIASSVSPRGDGAGRKPENFFQTCPKIIDFRPFLADGPELSDPLGGGGRWGQFFQKKKKVMILIFFGLILF